MALMAHRSSGIGDAFWASLTAKRWEYVRNKGINMLGSLSGGQGLAIEA